MKLKACNIEHSTAIILPKGLLAELGWVEGDTLFAAIGPDSSLHLTRSDPHFGDVLQIGREVFREYDETFKALAE